MIKVRKSDERGSFDHGWLKTCHTFSFASYVDREHVSFRSLRVLNEDWIAAGQGFGMHPHRDMEIVTVLLAGELEHRDSMGNGEVIRAGEVQHMTAGSGVMHSEANSGDRETHLLQIWILPDEDGLTPSYEQKPFPVEERRGRLQLVVSPDGREGSLQIHQDASMFLGSVSTGDSLRHELEPDRHSWIQVTAGEVEVLGERLEAGDGAAISDERLFEIRAAGDGDADVVVFDLS